MIHQARFELPEIEINLDGDVLVFDKPEKCTSFDLVEKVKRYSRNAESRKQRFDFAQRPNAESHEIPLQKFEVVPEGRGSLYEKQKPKKIKVGHAGTLDPLASGVMIICIGSFTKKIEQYQALEKEYTGTFFLGATTPSFDLEKPIDEMFPIEHITEENIYQLAQSFMGEQEQIPPHFSAVKVNGKRAYLLAREGIEPEIKPKRITIYDFEITRIALPEVDFRIVCSKGTYIRSIARDFGQKLNSGAHLTSLRRTRIGNFNITDAIEIQLTN
jgi:tRNA pseudouridine55 synthase